LFRNQSSKDEVIKIQNEKRKLIENQLYLYKEQLKQYTFAKECPEMDGNTPYGFR